jgi:hypothetical protein
MMHAITLKKIENEGSQMGHTKKYLEKKNDLVPDLSFNP